MATTTLKIQNAAYVNEAQGKRRNRNAKPVMCVETGDIYASVTDAAETVGCTIQTISVVIDKPNRTAKGMHFIFLNHLNDNIGRIGTRINVVNDRCATLEFKANRVDELEKINNELSAEAKRLQNEKVDLIMQMFKEMPPAAMDMFIEGMKLVRESKKEVV